MKAFLIGTTGSFLIGVALSVLMKGQFLAGTIMLTCNVLLISDMVRVVEESESE